MVDSASNRNEYQEYFLGIKAADAQGWQPCHLHVPNFLKSGSLNLLEPSGPVKACNGIALPYHSEGIVPQSVQQIRLISQANSNNYRVFLRWVPNQEHYKRTHFGFYPTNSGQNVTCGLIAQCRWQVKANTLLQVIKRFSLCVLWVSSDGHSMNIETGCIKILFLWGWITSRVQCLGVNCRTLLLGYKAGYRINYSGKIKKKTNPITTYIQGDQKVSLHLMIYYKNTQKYFKQLKALTMIE
jgi:hypothetical protein